MRVTLSDINVNKLAAAFGDFTKAEINEVIAGLLAERNTLKACLSGGGLQALPVQSNNSAPATQQNGGLYSAPPAELGDFAGLLNS